MDATTFGIIGGIVGTILGLAGSAFGCWVAYKVRGRNEAQRAYLRRAYALLIAVTPLFLAAVWLFSLRMLSPWIYAALLAIWVLGAMALSIHMSLRLDALADPAEREASARAWRAMPAQLRRTLVRLLAGIFGLVALLLLAIALVAAKLLPVWTIAIIVPVFLAGLGMIIAGAIRSLPCVKFT